MMEEYKRELISAFIDNELSSSERDSLTKEAETNKEIADEIERQKKFKQFILTKVKRVPLPNDSRQRIMSALAEEMSKSSELTNRIEPTPTPISRLNKKVSQPRPWLLVAAILLLSALIYLSRTNSTTLDDFKSVEFVSYQHFQNHSGSFVGKAYGIETTQQAIDFLKEHYSCDITVPELNGAQFAGVLYADFHDGFHTPLLSYKVAEDDFIYIFAFELKHLNNLTDLKREPNAVNAIIRHNDVFTVTFNEHDVLSWKWGDVWYSAVSKHKGNMIAAMLPH